MPDPFFDRLKKRFLSSLIVLVAATVIHSGCWRESSDWQESPESTLRPLNESPKSSRAPARPDGKLREESSGSEPMPHQPSPILLRDLTADTGITFVHTDGGGGNRYIMESVSAGLALLDYDGDGLIDIYFLNGAPLPGTAIKTAPRNALYRNLGGWRFRDVSEQAGVADTGYGLGVTVADFDNDGCPDLYLNNYGPNVLYHNLGDGTFADISLSAGVDNGNKVGAGACFFDFDRDGDLDLYSSNYIQLNEQVFNTFTMNGFPSYPGPNRFGAEPDTLFRNNGNGTFSDVSVETGIASHRGTSMGMVCLDFENDGDADIFICNDGQMNFLFENDGKGHFEEIGMISGVACDTNGDINGSMGVDCGDFNNDGQLDLFMTNYQFEPPVLYQNQGGGFFEDVSLVSGAGEASYDDVTWGPGLIDFDNDGHLDIFIACGHLQDNVSLYDDTTSYLSANLLLRNRGDGVFSNMAKQSGSGMEIALSSRGAAFGDLDNDGDIDAVILNSRSHPTLLKNESPTRNHWLQIDLEGDRSSRDGVGARVIVTAGELTQIAERHSGRGYQSHFGSRLHFGLGTHQRIDRIEVCWPCGHRDVLLDLATNQLIRIRQMKSQCHGSY